jgi:hypothetical protein
MMEKRDLEILVNNESEWRRYILQELSDLRKGQTDLLVTATTLKVKFGIIGSVFGAISGVVGSLVVDFIKHK